MKCAVYRTTDGRDRRYGPGGRLEEADGTVYAHDADGNQTEKREPSGATWAYAWNGHGHLAEVTRPHGSRVAFEYDAFARRTKKRVLDAEGALLRETRYVWDGHVVVHELDSGEGLTTWQWEPETFTPLAKEKGEQRFAIAADHLGTPTEMVDDLGHLAWKMQLDVFGVPSVEVGERGDCPFRWPGQLEDEETGLYYNRHRYYDPAQAGYVAEDPIRIQGGLRAYGYPNDTVSGTDPLGLACVDIGQRRRTVAYNFYRRAGMPHNQALAHMRGIDFSKPVSVRRLKAGKEVSQWRTPSRPVGSYFSEPGTSAAELGINPKGRSEEIFVVTQDTKALSSTASNITDTWTDPINPFDAAGGGKQYFVPNNLGLVPVGI